MRVDVLYFGVLKDRFGAGRDAVELGDGADVAALLERMQGGRPQEAAAWKSLAVAVNREYAQLSTVLHEGDEVALLPPVSGGCDAG